MFSAGLKEINEQGSVLEKADGTFVPEGPLPSGPATIDGTTIVVSSIVAPTTSEHTFAVYLSKFRGLS